MDKRGIAPLIIILAGAILLVSATIFIVYNTTSSSPSYTYELCLNSNTAANWQVFEANQPVKSKPPIASEISKEIKANAENCYAIEKKISELPPLYYAKSSESANFMNSFSQTCLTNMKTKQRVCEPINLEMLEKIDDKNFLYSFFKLLPKEPQNEQQQQITADRLALVLAQFHMGVCTDKIDGCCEIVLPGEYKLTDDIGSFDGLYSGMPAGAQNPAHEIICLAVSASSVVIDCDGHEISPSFGNYGAYIFNQKDVTLKNCKFSGESYNIAIDKSGASIINNEVNGDGYFEVGIYSFDSNVSIQGNSVSKTATGYLIEGGKVTLEGNKASGNSQADYLIKGVSNSDIRNNIGTKMSLQGSSNNNLQGNILHSGQISFDSSSTGNKLSNNKACLEPKGLSCSAMQVDSGNNICVKGDTPDEIAELKLQVKSECGIDCGACELIEETPEEHGVPDYDVDTGEDELICDILSVEQAGKYLLDGLTIDRCGIINKPGKYSVNSFSIDNYVDTMNTLGACIVICSNDVTFDCGGNKISGNGLHRKISEAEAQMRQSEYDSYEEGQSVDLAKDSPFATMGYSGPNGWDWQAPIISGEGNNSEILNCIIDVAAPKIYEYSRFLDVVFVGSNVKISQNKMNNDIEVWSDNGVVESNSLGLLILEGSDNLVLKNNCVDINFVSVTTVESWGTQSTGAVFGGKNNTVRENIISPDANQDNNQIALRSVGTSNSLIDKNILDCKGKEDLGMYILIGENNNLLSNTLIRNCLVTGFALYGVKLQNNNFCRSDGYSVYFSCDKKVNIDLGGNICVANLNDYKVRYPYDNYPLNAPLGWTDAIDAYNQDKQLALECGINCGECPAVL